MSSGFIIFENECAQIPNQSGRETKFPDTAGRPPGISMWEHVNQSNLKTWKKARQIFAGKDRVSTCCASPTGTGQQFKGPLWTVVLPGRDDIYFLYDFFKSIGQAVRRRTCRTVTVPPPWRVIRCESLFFCLCVTRRAKPSRAEPSLHTSGEIGPRCFCEKHRNLTASFVIFHMRDGADLHL